MENKEEAFAETDAAVEDFRAMVEGNGGFVAEKYQPALAALDNLAALRKQVTDYQGERSIQLNPFVREVFDGYTAIMDEIYDANAQVVPTISNARLRRGAELADTSAHQRDISAQFIRTLLRTVVETPADGVDTPAEINELATLLGTLRRNAETIQTKAEGPYEKMADELFAKEHIRKYPEVIQNVLDTGDVDINLVLETSTGDEAGGFGYTVFSKQVNDQLRADADDVRADADRRLRTYGILAALAIALALVTTWLVSKSLTRPLRALTRQATEMASSRLPNAVRSILNTPLGEDVEIPQVEPITVKTRDEVGDVAEALNTVQETALELAVEQAVLRRNIADSFVNLGRRNQNLLGRQLDFITELEVQRDRPRHPRLALPARPPRHPHAPQRRVAARARRHRPAAALERPGAAQRRHPGGPRRGRGLPAGLGRRAWSRPPSWARPPPTSPTSSPSSSRTPSRSPRPTRTSRSAGATSTPATRSPSSTTASAWPPTTSSGPTAGSPGRRASPWPRRSTWATTSPATWPPATRSRCASSSRPGRA